MDSISHQVSLLVRLWIEISFHSCNQQKILSASLWGCELKCHNCRLLLWVNFVQPPCEAVNWKMSAESLILFPSSVSLLVRLWIEMEHYDYVISEKPGQPPCEAVNWNTHRHSKKIKKITVSLLVRLWIEMLMDSESEKVLYVSLLVRLWIEITWYSKNKPKRMSASLWGCELKYTSTWYIIPR